MPNLLDVTNVADCDTVEKLTQRVYEYIHWSIRSDKGAPPKLTSINRRFAPKAAKLGTSARAMTGILANAGRIEMYERNGATVFMDTEFLNMQREMLEPSEQHKALEMILSRAE